MTLLPLIERAARRALNVSGLKSRWIQTSIAHQHLYDGPGRGALPPVVVLHGISSAATPFAPVLQRLRPEMRRVLAPDMPGHGFSGAPVMPLTPVSLFEAMSELLDGALDEPAILAGNSLGGAVALHYAIRCPERVRGVFLTSPAGAAMETEAFKRFIRTFQIQTKADARAFMDRLYHKPPWFVPLLSGDVQRLFARESIRSFTAAARADDLLTAEQLGVLKVPVHLVWGRSERLMPEENLRFFKKHLPAHATIEEPEGFGHCPHLEAPGRVARRIIAFAQRITHAP